jgi:hypothetical protein
LNDLLSGGKAGSNDKQRQHFEGQGSAHNALIISN